MIMRAIDSSMSKGMLKVFLSSTFKDLRGERAALLNNLTKSLEDVSMENFLPDGKNIQKASIEELRKSDIAIFLISPYYGTLIDICEINDCEVSNCPMKNNTGKISYTHCEYKISLARNMPHLTYLMEDDFGWGLIERLRGMSNDEFDKFQRESDAKTDLKHYYMIANPAAQFREEASKGLSLSIARVDRITSDLADGIVKWYQNGEVDIRDFIGRREKLAELMDHMNQSVEVYGIGGVGKTSLIHVALLLRKLKGEKIIVIGTSPSYRTGSGYTHFWNKSFLDFHEIIGNRLTIDEIAYAIGIQNDVLDKQISEKKSLILDEIQKKNICLFIDDFDISDDEVKHFVRSSVSCNLIIAAKSRMGIAKAEVCLPCLHEDESDDYAKFIAGKFRKEIDRSVREKICMRAEGHPVLTEIFVRNWETINFEEDGIKRVLNGADQGHADEFHKRVLEGILDTSAIELMKKLSMIDPEPEDDIDWDTVKAVEGTNLDSTLNSLNKTGMLIRKNSNNRMVYSFAYKYLSESVKDGGKKYHEWAIKYYNYKLKNIKNNPIDKIELLYHKSFFCPTENHARSFHELNGSIEPCQVGFVRLIDTGEQLKSFLRKKGKGGDYAALLGSIAFLYHKEMRFGPALKNYKDALNLYESLARTDPGIYNPYLAMIYNNLAVLYSNSKKFEMAKESCQQALTIYRELSLQDQDAYNPKLASTLNNLANLYNILNEFNNAKECHIESIRIRRSLAKKNPDMFTSDLAMSYNNLAILYFDLKKFKAAENNYRKALEIYKQLSILNKRPFAPRLASTYNNVAILCFNMRKFDAAEENYNNALQIYRDLVHRNCDAFEPKLASTINNLADLYTFLDRLELAKDYYNEALRIRVKLSELDSDSFGSDLADTLASIANLCIILKNYNDAEKYYLKALKILTGLAKPDSEAFNSDISKTEKNIGRLYSELNKFDKAKEHYEVALKHYEILEKQNPLAFNSDLAMTFDCLGNLYADRDYFDAADENYESALKLSEKMAEINPVIGKYNLAQILKDRANLYRKRRKIDRSIQFYTRALSIANELAERNYTGFEKLLAEVKSDMVNLILELGQDKFVRDPQ
jgi:tetratricopeptide (TPR) repeat protein